MLHQIFTEYCVVVTTFMVLLVIYCLSKLYVQLDQIRQHLGIFFGHNEKEKEKENTLLSSLQNDFNEWKMSYNEQMDIMNFRMNEMENKIKKIKNKKPNNDDQFTFDVVQSHKGFYLRDFIDYGVETLHMMYNSKDHCVYGLIITNFIQPKIHPCYNEIIVEDGRSERSISDLTNYENEKEDPFTISFDRIIRPSYITTTWQQKVHHLSRFFKKFHSLKTLIIHKNHKIDLLKLHVCIVPLLEKIKTEQDVNIEILYTDEECFTTRECF